jgi:hypothetical protein
MPNFEGLDYSLSAVTFGSRDADEEPTGTYLQRVTALNE